MGQSVLHPPLAFEKQPIVADVKIMQSVALERNVRVQLQARIEDEILSTTILNIPPKQIQQTASISIPALTRGQHLLSFHILPLEEEKIIWDNAKLSQVEVMPNTLGVLHLLGSPSWDGRFLRRTLKAEPKYDLISFFILRDPHDFSLTNERELSLIPFPVSRLFTEELPSFKIIILQNFYLTQFLLPQYQKNLVKFVKNGGSLLFIGGDMALQSRDLLRSPLSEIIPFVLENSYPRINLPRGVMNLGLTVTLNLKLVFQILNARKGASDYFSRLEKS